MDSLKNILQLQKYENIPNLPKIILKGGKPTKKFLNWNLKQLREKRTTYYADSSKYYDPIKKNIKKIPRDKRFINFTPKTSFIKKNKKLDSVYAPSNYFDNNYNKKEFSYILDPHVYNVEDAEGFMTKKKTYNEDDNLNNNLLINDIIKKNNISGEHRIIIIGNRAGLIFDNNYNIANNFWKEHQIDFQVSSENMKWNDRDIVTIGEKVTFIFTKEKHLNYKFYDQAFLDGSVSHCFFNPIKNYFNNIVETTKSKSTEQKYQSLVNKIIGKTLKTGEQKKGYLEIFKKGINQKDISLICEELQIEVKIEKPFSDETLFEYKSNKKPLKKFTFINTRADHVEYQTNNDLFKSYEATKITTREMETLKKQFIKTKTFHIFTKNHFGITSLKTLENYYTIQDDYFEDVKEFEKNTPLEFCRIDALKYPKLQTFIDRGTHFNGTVDFKNTEHLRNIGKNNEKPVGINHIDMTKAYTQYESSKYYNGFMGHITDFRKVDNYKQKGLYFIESIDFSKCSTQFIKLNKKLKWFIPYNIYTDAELKALYEQKAIFYVTHGAFGTRFDMKLNDNMINKKVLIKDFYDDNKKNVKIPYYCKYFGMISSTPKTKSIYMNGHKNYFENMISNKTKIFYDYDDKTARITYDKKRCYNKKHITAQIVAYQRLIMLEQLMKMDYTKLVRICVDGIYYETHSFPIHKSFSIKTEMTFRNAPCTEYLSNLFFDDEIKPIELPNAEPRKFYKTELFDGEGGLGKTYYNIFIDKGLIDVCYIPHSWKLSTSQTKQLEREQKEKLQSKVHYHIFHKEVVNCDILSQYSNILIDECSMLTEQQKEYIIKNALGKVIFMGDIDLQLAPCEGEQMNRKGIDKITRLDKNWRFQDNKMIELNKTLRNNGDTKYIDYFNLGIKTITKEELKKQYKSEDIILNYYKENTYSEMFKDIEKFKITSNTRDYKNGEIVFDKNIKSKKEFRHGYTIHSVQGETFDKNIYIDIKSRKGKTLLQNRLFYTAISRAKYFSQLHLII